MKSTVTPLYKAARQAHDEAMFERWLKTGEVSSYGPAIRIVLDRARATILASREAERS